MFYLIWIVGALVAVGVGTYAAVLFERKEG